MKRIGIWGLVIVLVCCMIVPCCAAGVHEGDVYAKYVNAVEKEEAPVEDGKVEITTDNGSSITIEKTPEGAVVLEVVVVPPEDSKVVEWFTDIVGEEIVIKDIFNIFFKDKDGNQFAANRVDITIRFGKNTNARLLTVAEVSSTLAVLGVDSEGNCREIACEANGDSVTFTADGSEYYVIVEKEESVQPSESESEEPTTEEETTEEETEESSAETESSEEEETPSKPSEPAKKPFWQTWFEKWFGNRGDKPEESESETAEESSEETEEETVTEEETEEESSEETESSEEETESSESESQTEEEKPSETETSPEKPNKGDSFLTKLLKWLFGKK